MMIFLLEGFMHHFPGHSKLDCLCSSIYVYTTEVLGTYVLFETPEVQVLYSLDI